MNAPQKHTLNFSQTGARLEEVLAGSFFDETTRKYAEAYRHLEEQFSSLSLRLEEANLELGRSLDEKDRVSNYLNNILESLSAGVLVVDLEGNLTLFNRAAEAISGRSEEEVLGRPYQEVIGLHAGREKSVLHTVESGQVLSSMEKVMVLPDGRSIPLGFSTAPVCDSGGEIIGAVEVFTDLTEAKRMEAELQRAHTLAALGEMAATVAHEIRNPLGGMAGFAAILERDLEEGDPRRRLVGKISEGIARLNRIVSSLLAYTRPLQLNPHPVDLVELVKGTASFFAVDPACTEAGVSISCRHTASDIVCNLDPEQFRQVILNLLQNATQAMPAGGVIDVEVGVSPTRDPPRATLRVCDGGVGMSPEVRQKLFTPFFTTKEDGTGLGLVTCKKIVEAHGGAIRAECREPGGTCFTISLPR